MQLPTIQAQTGLDLAVPDQTGRDLDLTTREDQTNRVRDREVLLRTGPDLGRRVRGLQDLDLEVQVRTDRDHTVLLLKPIEQEVKVLKDRAAQGPINQDPGRCLNVFVTINLCRVSA